MSALHLESYFFLSEGQGPGHGDITLPRDTPAIKDSRELRILEVANALASICVHDPKSEVYAVAFRLTGESLKVYVAENSGVPEKTKDHLKNLFSQLSQIATTASQSTPEKFGDAVTSSQRNNFGTMILKHHFPKFLHSLTKRGTPWTKRVARIKEDLIDDLGDGNDKVEMFQTIIKNLDGIYGIAHLYEETHHEQLLSMLYSCLSELDTVIRRSSATQLITELLRWIDPGDEDAPNRLLELEGDADINADGTLRAGFSMTRYIYRILATVIHTRRLLRLAVSLSFVKFFTNPVEVECCPLREQSITIYPHNLLKLGTPSLVSPFETTKEVKTSLHAELNVFQTLLEAALVKKEQPYWVIGISKLMCVGCYTVVGKAFPTILRQHMVQVLAPITVQGCHGKLSSSWAAPDLSFAEQYIGFDLNLEIRKRAENFIWDDLHQYSEHRRLYGSSGAFESSENGATEKNLHHRRIIDAYSNILSDPRIRKT